MQLYDQGEDGIDIVLRYEAVGWTTGDLEGGWNGLGGDEALIGWRLIPAREDGGITSEDLDAYIAELVVPKGSKHIGKRLAELEEIADKSDVVLIGLMRDGKRRYGRARNAELRAGDALVLEATPDALDEFRSRLIWPWPTAPVRSSCAPMAKVSRLSKLL